MRVLHVTETAKGGVGSFLEELIPLQAERFGSENVCAIVPLQDRPQLGSVNDKQIRPFNRRERSFSSLLEMRVRLRQSIREFRPTILHLHSTFAGVIGRLAVDLRRDVKIIYNPHGWSFEMWPSGPKREVAALAERAMAMRCDRIVAVCETEQEQGIAIGLPREKISVVHNGISDDFVSNQVARWDDQRLKVLFVGRLDRQKGIDTLASIASRQVRRLTVRVIGEEVVGSDTRRLTAPNIDYLGWVDRNAVAAQMQACDVVAMPSRWEGLSITALEAMRAAKPLVAFSVGGMGEAIVDGLTGRLIPAGDVAGFELALLSEPFENWSLMGVAAQARFRDLFTAHRMADRLAQIYASV